MAQDNSISLIDSLIDWLSDIIHSIKCTLFLLAGLLLIVDHYNILEYKVLATLLPSVSVSNSGYNGLSHGDDVGILISDRVNQDLY